MHGIYRFFLYFIIRKSVVGRTVKSEGNEIFYLIERRIYEIR